MTAEMFGPAKPSPPASTAVPADALERSAEEAAQKLATLNMAAHAATKARARGAVI